MNRPAPTIQRIYLASSWRTPYQPRVLEHLREAGFETYDFRNPGPGEHGFQWAEIDRHWEYWTPTVYREALADPIAEHGFGLDYEAMRWADTCVLLLPSGRSAHIEAGWMAGSGRRLYILMLSESEPELMYKLATGICLSVPELIQVLRSYNASTMQAGQGGNPGGAVRE